MLWFWGCQLLLIALLGYVWVIFGMGPYSLLLSAPVLLLGAWQPGSLPQRLRPIAHQSRKAAKQAQTLREAVRIEPIMVTAEVQAAMGQTTQKTQAGQRVPVERGVNMQKMPGKKVAVAGSEMTEKRPAKAVVRRRMH